MCWQQLEHKNAGNTFCNPTVIIMSSQTRPFNDTGFHYFSGFLYPVSEQDRLLFETRGVFEQVWYKENGAL